MDVNNEKLKVLFERVDDAFKALMRDPNSRPLHEEYELAKHELNSCLSSMRKDLNHTNSHANLKHH